MHPSSHLFTPASPPDSHLLSFASTSRLSTSISRHVLCLSLSTSTSTSTSRHVLYLPPLPLTPFYTTRLVFCLPSSASRLLPLVFCLPPPFYPPPLIVTASGLSPPACTSLPRMRTAGKIKQPKPSLLFGHIRTPQRPNLRPVFKPTGSGSNLRSIRTRHALTPQIIYSR